MSKKPPGPGAFETYQDFIAAEFNYISQTAFQAQEDRARSSEFFLIGIGSFIAAIFSSQFEVSNLKLYSFTFSLLFAVITFLGALTVIQLCRLRLAWLESIKAMNAMKDFLLSHNPELAPCFKWRSDTIPPSFNKRGIGFLLSLEVSVLSGVAAGASFYFGSLAMGLESVFPYSILTAVLIAAIYITRFYYLPLRAG